MPRDHEGSFEPQLIAKHERHFDGFDDKILSMYARGMTVREIRAHLQEIYGVDVSPDLISRVTDAVIDETTAWQTRPLEPVYLSQRTESPRPTAPRADQHALALQHPVQTSTPSPYSTRADQHAEHAKVRLSRGIADRPAAPCSTSRPGAPFPLAPQRTFDEPARRLHRCSHPT